MGQAACGCGGREREGPRPLSRDGFVPLAKAVRGRVREDAWAEVIAHFMARVRSLLGRRFDAYARSHELDAAAAEPGDDPAAFAAAAAAVARDAAAAADRERAEDAEHEARNQALYAAVWHRYDDRGSGTLHRAEFARAVLDLLMQQRKHAPALFEALRTELADSTREALERVRDDTGVGREFVDTLMPAVEEAVAVEVDELGVLMDQMIMDHAGITRALWRRMHDGDDPERTARDVFVRRYETIAAAVLDAGAVVDRLAGMEAARRRARTGATAQAAADVLETAILATERAPGAWAPAIAAAVRRVQALFRERHGGVDGTGTGDAGPGPQRAWDARCAGLLGAVFDRYDRNRDGAIDRHECKTLVLELLMEEKECLRRLLDALVQSLLEIVKEDAARPPPAFPVAIPVSFADEHYVRAVSEATTRAADAAHSSLDHMLQDYAAIAGRVWSRLDEERDGIVTRAAFVERFRRVAVPWRLIEPNNLADHLMGGGDDSSDEELDVE